MRRPYSSASEGSPKQSAVVFRRSTNKERSCECRCSSCAERRESWLFRFFFTIWCRAWRRVPSSRIVLVSLSSFKRSESDK
uniref:Uncharacterized protein n=1 Tax=Pyxicephalus adspersus TaxID=30357 RepID=A0AAV3AEH5_PYXAD|nr:TPA: hypothetical protein GDO54_012899 [Pyxicephalus adspersus]